jgi:hypothetical protein
MDHFFLAIRNVCGAVRPKLLFGERLWMMAMGVQGQHHRRTFLHDSYSRMATAVDSSLMSFRQAKPAFQIQVVARPIAAISAGKETGFEAGHQTPHLLTDRIRIGQQLALQRPECLFSFRATPGRWVQQRIDFTSRYDIPGHLFLRRRYQAPSFVDTAR